MRRRTYREKYYSTIQGLLTSIADQQLVAGIALLAAGIRYQNSGGAALYYVQLIVNLAALSTLCFITALEFSGLPLEESYHGQTDDPEEYKIIQKNRYSARLNRMRILLQFVYHALYTTFVIKAFSDCGNFDPEDPTLCFQTLFSWSILNCWPGLILQLSWFWYDYLQAVNRRSRMFHRIFMAIGRKFGAAIKWLFSLIPRCIIRATKTLVAMLPFRTWWHVLTAKTFWEKANYLFYVGTALLGFLISFYSALDIKLSTEPVLEGSEGEWGFGQIMPIL
jgi:hypothetical protein